jgi:hypothetical protein
MTETPKRHGGQFKPGQSGNPGGRPKVVGEVTSLARECTVESVETLREIMRNKKAPAQARVAAANSLLDRGYGKPAQSLDVGLTRKVFDDMSDAELAAIAGGATNETRAH